MRDSYKKFWKTALVEKMGYALPIFELKETPSRKSADEGKRSEKWLEYERRFGAALVTIGIKI